MRAARLYQPGVPLKVETVSKPQLKAGAALVRVSSTFIPPFTANVMSGALGYTFPEPLPFTPGPVACGAVEAVADDVFGIKPGDSVVCDAYMSVATHTGTDNGILIGWTGIGAEYPKMQALWRDGAWAEYVLWPSELLTPTPSAVGSVDPGYLAGLAYMAIPYGGFIRGGLRPGERVMVAGATGALGTGAVLVALAMGASKVYAVGRSASALEALKAIDTKRVATVVLPSDVSQSGVAVESAAGPVDLVIDTLGGVQSAEPTLACIRRLRNGGRAVLMGGVKADLGMPYAELMIKNLSITGVFMYPRSAIRELLCLVESGALDLEKVQLHKFALDDINTAIEEAAELKGLDFVVVEP